MLILMVVTLSYMKPGAYETYYKAHTYIVYAMYMYIIYHISVHVQIVRTTRLIFVEATHKWKYVMQKFKSQF